MKQQTLRRAFLGVFLALGLACSAGAALVTVSSTETWDGVSNPHASDGVTLSGSGNEASPKTYTIPNGPCITFTGRINFQGASDHSIKFVIRGGDLQLDAGAERTRSMRDGGSARAANYNVQLQALSPLGNYNPNDRVNNSLTIKLTVTGGINTLGRTRLAGDVTLQSAVCQIMRSVARNARLAVNDLRLDPLA